MSGVMDMLLKDIVSLDDDALALVKRSGIKRLNHFVTIPRSDLAGSLGAVGMDLGDVHDVLAFQDYYCAWRELPTKQNIEKDLTTEAWEAHLDNIATKKKSSTVGASTSIPTLSVTNVLAAKSSDAFASFKWDTKNVPVLPKNKSINEAYDSWEESFLVQMTLANVVDVLEPSWVSSSDPDEMAIENKKMGIVKAALLHATMGTTAAPYMNAKDSGREMFESLRAAYCGHDALLRKAEAAHHELATLEFGPKPKLSAEQFASTFKLCLKRMEESGTAYPTNVIKSTFLTKVTHPDYAHFRYNETTNGSTFEEMLRRFHDLTLLLRNSNQGKSDANHKMVNNATGNNDDKKNKNKNKKDKKAKNKYDDYISKDAWAKLTDEERRKIIAERGKRRDADQNKSSSGNLPMQYGGHSLSNTVSTTPNPPSFDEYRSYLQALQSGAANSSSNTSLSSNATRAGQLLQNLPNRSGPMSVNNLKVVLSPMVQSLILNQASASMMDVPLEGYEAPMCIDGGTNISLMGRVFHIVEFTNRTVDMVGFASGIEKSQVRIGSGVAVFESGNDKVLLGLHEALYLPDNSISLLSTSQARENGVWVDDVLSRHGGRQLIRATDAEGNPYDFPLELRSGLMELTLRYPTETERESLPIVWLTSDSL